MRLLVDSNLVCLVNGVFKAVGDVIDSSWFF